MSFGSASGVDLNTIGDTLVTVPNPAPGSPFVITKLSLSDTDGSPAVSGLRLGLFGAADGASPYEGISPAWQLVTPGKIGFAPYNLNGAANVVLTGDSVDVYVRVTQANGAALHGTVAAYAESVPG